MLLPDAITPAIEAVLQIAPRASLSAATAAWAQRNGPIKLVVRIVDQKLSVSASRFSNGIGIVVAGVPALLTRKSRRPSASMAFATMRSACSGCDTSPGAVITRHPCTLRRSTSRGPRGSSGRWLSATAAPLRAKASAVASPMPEAAPVTSAAFPERSALIMRASLDGSWIGDSMSRPLLLSSLRRVCYRYPPPGKGGRHGTNPAAVPPAVAVAPSRLCRARPRGEPPLLRGSPRDPAGRDLVREELQQRAQQGDRVLPYLLWHGGRQLARLLPIRRPGNVRAHSSRAAGQDRPLRPHRLQSRARDLQRAEAPARARRRDLPREQSRLLQVDLCRLTRWPRRGVHRGSARRGRDRRRAPRRCAPGVSALDGRRPPYQQRAARPHLLTRRAAALPWRTGKYREKSLLRCSGTRSGPARHWFSIWQRANSLSDRTGN